MILIRPETEEDYPEVYRVIESAFGGTEEADLVDRLRQTARPYISLVAVLDSQVVGHIFFSPVSVEPESSPALALGLAPMAVLPEYQNRSIGSQLVREGLGECERLGYYIVVVLGHPRYYPRFGFTPARARGLYSEYDVADDVFMVTELKPGALEGREGLVKYHPEFNKL